MDDIDKLAAALTVVYMKLNNMGPDDFECKEHLDEYRINIHEQFYNLSTMPVDKAFALARKNGWLWKRWKELVWVAIVE